MRAAAAPRIVLVASADAMLRHELRAVLAELGFVVHDAPDGVRALDEIDRVGPHAVIVQLTLPRLDGFAVLARLRAGASTRALPVIALADAPDEETELRAFDAGATECVARPFRARVLAARLRAMVGARTDDLPLRALPATGDAHTASVAPPV